MQSPPRPLVSAVLLLGLASLVGCGEVEASSEGAAVAPLPPDPPAVCADPSPTTATIDLTDVGSPTAIVPSKGEIFLGIAGRGDEPGAIYRARFDTGTVEKIAPGYHSTELVRFGDRFVYREVKETSTGHGTLLEPGPLVTFDTIDGSRIVHEDGPIVEAGPWSGSRRGEVTFRGHRADGSAFGIWSWNPERGFEQLTDDDIGIVFSDDTDLYRLLWSGPSQRMSLDRLDRASSRFVSVFEATAPIASKAVVDRDAFYLYDPTARNFQVWDKSGRSLRSFERTVAGTVPHAARVVAADDALYVLEDGILHRVDKVTGADEEVGVLPYHQAINAVAADACYVYAALAAGPGKLVRLAK